MVNGKLKKTALCAIFLLTGLYVYGSEHSVAALHGSGVTRIDVDTTWSLSGSPYSLAGDVQVAPGVTLTVEPGVVVEGNGRGIQVWGVLDVAGEEEARVVFDQAHIRPGTNSEDDEPYLISVQFAELRAGSICAPTGNEGYGSLQLTDTMLIDTAHIYLWYPAEDCHIERNVFIDSGGISVGTDQSDVYIRNNVFYRQKGYGAGGRPFAVQTWAAYGESGTIVEHNSFLSTDRFALCLPPGYTNTAMEGAHNYWGATDEAVIQSMIYDKNFSLDAAGHIEYRPFLTAPHEDTPALPAELPPAPEPPPRPVKPVIIDEDTTWTETGSPYILQANVQVAPGVTLTVEPGVVVEGNGRGIQVWGVLDVAGEEEARVVFDKGHIWPGTNSEDDEPYLIRVQYAGIRAGSICAPTGNEGYGSLQLTDSMLIDTAHIYLWYPAEDCHIERNVFIDSGGISVGTDQSDVYIRNNVFYRQKGYGAGGCPFAVQTWAAYGESGTIVEYNSFLSTDRFALCLPPGYTNTAMEGAHNYWGATDEAVIQSMIYDRNQSDQSASYIEYSPFLTAPHELTPPFIIYGDISGNGKVEFKDALLVLRHISGLAPITEEQQAHAPVSGEGTDIHIGDTNLILKYVIGLIDRFPVETVFP